MYKNLIKNYINHLKLEDLNNILLKNNIKLKEKEDVILFKYIKTRNEDLFNGNVNNILYDLKKEISNDTYYLILEYYEKYKKYLQ